MKAAGAVAVTQAAQTAVITSGAVIAAGLVTGAIWLVPGLTGAARKIADSIPRFVVVGIVLGLGMAFMIEDGVMNTTKRYLPEVRERAVRLVFEHEDEHESQWAAIEPKRTVNDLLSVTRCHMNSDIITDKPLTLTRVRSNYD
jgi:hypothetical protein